MCNIIYILLDINVFSNYFIKVNFNISTKSLVRHPYFTK